jgi:hypothetical protein
VKRKLGLFEEAIVDYSREIDFGSQNRIKALNY